MIAGEGCVWAKSGEIVPDGSVLINAETRTVQETVVYENPNDVHYMQTPKSWVINKTEIWYCYKLPVRELSEGQKDLKEAMDMTKKWDIRLGRYLNVDEDR